MARGWSSKRDWRPGAGDHWFWVHRPHFCQRLIVFWEPCPLQSTLPVRDTALSHWLWQSDSEPGDLMSSLKAIPLQKEEIRCHQFCEPAHVLPVCLLAPGPKSGLLGLTDSAATNDDRSTIYRKRTVPCR